MREGDFIISIGDRDVKWSSHAEAVRLIQNAGETLTLRLATPMDKHQHKVSKAAKALSHTLFKTLTTARVFSLKRASERSQHLSMT